MSPELSFKKAGKEYKADLPDKTGTYYVEGLGKIHLDLSKIDPAKAVNILMLKGVQLEADLLLPVFSLFYAKDWDYVISQKREAYLSAEGTGRLTFPPASGVDVNVKLNQPIRERGWWARRHVIDPQTKQRIGTEYVRRSFPRGT